MGLIERAAHRSPRSTDCLGDLTVLASFESVVLTLAAEPGSAGHLAVIALRLASAPGTALFVGPITDTTPRALDRERGHGVRIAADNPRRTSHGWPSSPSVAIGDPTPTPHRRCRRAERAVDRSRRRPARQARSAAHRERRRPFYGVYEPPRAARRIAGPAFARREVSWPDRPGPAVVATSASRQVVDLLVLAADDAEDLQIRRSRGGSASDWPRCAPCFALI